MDYSVAGRKPERGRARRVLALCGLLALALCAGGPAVAADAPAATAAPRFVTTGPPVAAILAELVAGRAEVRSLVPAGASPHTYEPRPSDLAAAQQALGLFFVSPALDGWAARLPARARVELLGLVPRDLLLPNLESIEHAQGTAGDPHFWTDPLLVKAVLPALADALSRLDPGGAATYRANAAAFGARLDALDRATAQTLAPVKGRAVLLFHPSFQYLLRRYGLTIAGVLEPVPGKEPTPRLLQQFAGRAARDGVRAVFGEPQLPAGPVNALAEAAGIKAYQLDPLGGTAGRTSYAELIGYNARVLAEALK